VSEQSVVDPNLIPKKKMKEKRVAVSCFFNNGQAQQFKLRPNVGERYTVDERAITILLNSGNVYVVLNSLSYFKVYEFEELVTEKVDDTQTIPPSAPPNTSSAA
jgi:hypothetical protein